MVTGHLYSIKGVPNNQRGCPCKGSGRQILRQGALGVSLCVPLVCCRVKFERSATAVRLTAAIDTPMLCLNLCKAMYNTGLVAAGTVGVARALSLVSSVLGET